VTRRLDIEATADAVAAARTRPAETTDLPTSVLAPKTRCTRWVGCDDHDGVEEDENSSTSSSPRDDIASLGASRTADEERRRGRETSSSGPPVRKRRGRNASSRR
jgi:hypothetical protein